MKKQHRVIAVMCIAMFLLSETSSAQPFRRRNPPPPPDNPQDTKTTDIPLDGGLGILLAAGVGYGVKRIREERKKRAKN